MVDHLFGPNRLLYHVTISTRPRVSNIPNKLAQRRNHPNDDPLPRTAVHRSEVRQPNEERARPEERSHKYPFSRASLLAGTEILRVVSQFIEDLDNPAGRPVIGARCLMRRLSGRRSQHPKTAICSAAPAPSDQRWCNGAPSKSGPSRKPLPTWQACGRRTN